VVNDVIDIRDSAPWTRSTELFEGLTDSVCEAILSTCYRGGFSPNETIYREGEPKEAIFLLAEGRVKVSQVSKKGKEVLLWLNLPGQVIGSLNLVADGVHSSTARAVQSCKVLI